ncbi:MAG TPA: heterodisulfide reductase-related iron-sulfur binding cluster [Thermoanaerobaculia bacterium]|nr:heterodisulfide reductase-related iron-sulfur binding cluster [Thermoanaerobaculia bacterium]
MEAGVPTREIYWNVTQVWVMYLLLIPTLGIMAWGLWRRMRLWRTGQPAVRFDRLGQRLGLFTRNAILQARNNRNRYVAVFHTGLFAGFIVLFIATTVVAIHEDSKYVGLDLPIMQGSFYLVFQSLIVDLFGLWVLLGVGLAAWRRWSKKPRELVYTDEASWILVSIFVIVFTGFLVEGWRIAVTDDPWGHWSPVGYVLALGSDALMSDAAMTAVHRGSWWFHLLAAFAFIAWAPFTKMAHVLTSPLNVFTANLDGPGKSLKSIDFETAERLGINHLGDFTWKDLLDLDACTECGRCTAVCPANTVGKALSPRDIILDLQKLMHANAGSLLASLAASGAGPADAPTPGPTPQAGEGGGAPAPVLIPIIDPETAVSPEALFQCTTCAACVESCPVHIEQMPKIIDARRFLVMEKAEFPEGMMAAVTSLESRRHPFSGTQFNRVDWAEGLDLDVMAEMDDPKEAEVLFWVGCGGALVERNQATVRATAKLLKKAGVKFAILGREESCSGDPARRIGNEFLFEMLAKGNVETLNGYGVKQVVTSCPHCFNTFKNEYPEFGGHYEVHHHSQFLERLVREGRIDPQPKTGKKVVFHDPCYLGRHNGEYDAPREVLDAAAHGARVEIPRSRNNSFCCGGGGGMAFVDEPPNQRVNQERAQQLLDSGAEVVAVGCPFCTTMLEDGVNARKGDRDVTVMDVAQLLLESVGDEEAERAG